VIATGFQRDTLPEIDRRNPHFPFTMAAIPDHSVHTTNPPLAVEPLPEPEVIMQAVQPEPVVEEIAPADDYDTPAFLRKQKRMLQ
jgi:hypothetical protein